jgi:hypothetical protein
MSTRAVYSFIDTQRYHVYKHHDGYPSGAEESITAALGYSWPLPRFEADEFAASFVAANKQPANPESQFRGFQGGGIRLVACSSTKPPAAAAYGFASDLEYRYEIRAKGKDIVVTAFSAGDCTPKGETMLWRGKLSDMAEWAEKFEKDID